MRGSEVAKVVYTLRSRKQLPKEECRLMPSGGRSTLRALCLRRGTKP